MNNDWYLRSRRRYFLDYHIDGWNDEFLAKYDPEVYAEACFKSGATAATYMANTHSGLLNWQSETGGEVHPSLKGRDMLQETIDALHKRGWMPLFIMYLYMWRTTGRSIHRPEVSLLTEHIQENSCWKTYLG